MLPSYFHLQLSYFKNFSSIIFLISYIPHFPSSRSFFRFFSNLLSSGFPTLFLRSVSSCLPCPAVITFSRFVTSYFTRIFCARCHIASFPLFLTVSLLSFSNFFYEFVSYFPNSVPLISLMSCTPAVKLKIFSLFV